MQPSEIDVTVLNGTATAGLAATYGDKVEGKGFHLGAVSNTDQSFETSVVMFERGHAPEARKVAKQLGISKVELMSSEVEVRRGGGERRGRGRRGQCRGGGLAPAALVFALLVLATVAAFGWAQRLKRDPLVLDRVTFVGAPVLHPKNPVHSFTPNGDCRYDQVRIKFRVTRSDDATVQVVKPGGRVVVTLARDQLPQALPLLHLLLGRAPARRRHRRAGPLQAAGEAARPGTQPGPAGRDPPAPRAAREPAGDCEPGREAARLERLPRRRRRPASRPPPAPPRSCCPRAARARWRCCWRSASSRS